MKRSDAVRNGLFRIVAAAALLFNSNESEVYSGIACTADNIYNTPKQVSAQLDEAADDLIVCTHDGTMEVHGNPGPARLELFAAETYLLNIQADAGDLADQVQKLRNELLDMERASESTLIYTGELPYCHIPKDATGENASFYREALKRLGSMKDIVGDL